MSKDGVKKLKKECNDSYKYLYGLLGLYMFVAVLAGGVCVDDFIKDYIFPITSTRIEQDKCEITRIYNDGDMKVFYNGDNYTVKNEDILLTDLAVGDKVSCQVSVSERKYIKNKINIDNLKEISK